MTSKKNILWIIVAVIIVSGAFLMTADNDDSEITANASGMTFFVTSSNPGDGANFGGLAGADAHCQALAEDAGAGARTWHAYLSTDTVNARERIGNGPWHNIHGVLIAESVAGLHSDNAISKETALDENGELVNGRGDSPNVHDILTGSTPDGTTAFGDEDTTCSNWTSGGDGSAIVGHHDRMGLDESDEATSWNSSHASRGCSLPDLNGTGGGGLLYCFAVGE